MIYLDHAATTPMSPEVLEAMLPYLKDSFGNPGSIHACGRSARDAVQRARAQVAALFHCKPEQVIFTSGGTEGNNLVIKGLEDELLRRRKYTIVTTEIEHDSVLNAVQEMCIKRGFHCLKARPQVSGIPGMVGLPEIRRLLDREATGFASVMAVNNETGVINDVVSIGDYCREHGILFHIDAVQAAGIEDLDTAHVFPCDFMTVSSHKIHGPKGMGAVFARDPSMLSPLISGGAEQEFGLRGGTENVAGIVGFGKACELTLRDLDENCARMENLQSVLLQTLSRRAEESGLGLKINGNVTSLSPKTLNICIPGVDAQTLLLMLDVKQIFCSAGSACTAHYNTPSHVLIAMGLDEEDARSSIRISMSSTTTAEEVVEAAEEIVLCAQQICAIHN